MSASKKPSSCIGCPLEKKGLGYAKAVGPIDANILVVGEALGMQEALQGIPFVGEAGSVLDKCFRYTGIDRSEVRIDNTTRCKSPNNWLDGAPWEFGAIKHCAQNLDATLAEGHQVVVPVGGTAIHNLLGYSKKEWKSFKKPMENFHGTIHRDPTNRFWVVPSFQPSFIQRGNHKLIAVLMHDLLIAKEIAEKGHEKDPAVLKVDPPVEWFLSWVDTVIARATECVLAGEKPPWLATDIETPEKAKGVDESEISVDDPSFVITRINFAVDFDLDFALTVPWSGPYIAGVKRLMNCEFLRKAFWNCPTPDQKVLTADLKWVPAGNLKLGDKLVGFDEYVEEGRKVRRYREAMVTMNVRAKAPKVFKVSMSDGTTIKVSAEHKWLLKPSSSNDTSDSKIGRRYKWIKTEDLKVGTTVQRLFDTWEEGQTKAHGYLAGMYDGEGCLTLQKATKTMKVQISQALGKTFNTIGETLRDLGFDCAEYIKNKRKKDSHIGQTHIAGRTEDIAKFLGCVRPQRLLDKFKPEYLGALQTKRAQDVTITAIEDLGEQEVVILSTDERTYILEGFGAHNCNYDRPRLNSNGCKVRDPWYDIMDAWHMLQSSLPKGLGFVSPFYSKYGAWKHLSSSDPGLYAAIDALQTVRCAVGIECDLLNSGQWEAFNRHSHLLDRYALKPAEDVGLRVEKGDPEKGTGLYGFQKALEAERGRISEEIAKLIPEKLLPLEGNYKRRPVDKETKEFKPEYFEVKAKTMTYKCQACQKIEATKKHRCKERKLYEEEHKGKSPLLFDEWEISRWCIQGEFNPASPQQVLGYIYWKKHQPGKNKKTKAPSADVQVIEKLWKKHNDPFYEFLLDLRKIDKIKGTYVDGAIRQMDENGRIHTIFTNKPSTWRMSSQGFNVTNVVSQDKKEDKLGLGAKFRACVVPQKGCKLIELDFAGIEAVQVGWFAADPQYIRLSKLGMHAFVASHAEEFPEEPAQKEWGDKKLGEYLKYIKNEPKYKLLYNKSKRATHGTAYGLTAFGLRSNYPELYPETSDAQKVIDLILKKVAPSVYKWQESIKLQAHEQHYLGGETHPYKYKHWFWNVYNYKRVSAYDAGRFIKNGRPCVQHGNTWYQVTLGDDAKRAIAFFPQSTAGGNIREVCLRLFTPGSEYYIGDVFYGKTPFRMPIHDSLVLEAPNSKVDYTLEKALAAMSLPIKEQPCPLEWGIGEYLTIGVDAEVGTDWAKMEKVT